MGSTHSSGIDNSIVQEAKANKVILGVLFVAMGSASYGMLSTFVKLAYKDHYSTAEVTVAQFLIGFFVLLGLKSFAGPVAKLANKVDIRRLMLAGIPTAMTSILYYVSVKYIDASVAVVLLMQAVWIGVVIEAFQRRRLPEINKVIAVVLILIGTVLATDLIHNSNLKFDIRGFAFGLAAAVSFSLVLLSTSSVAKHLHAFERSFYMICGGAVVVAIFAVLTQVAPYYLHINLLSSELITSKPFDIMILFPWGILVALLGTVVPPILLNKGFPLTGVGLGSIVSSLELPCAIVIASILLGEVINLTQWSGVITILGSIVLMNYKILLRR